MKLTNKSNRNYMAFDVILKAGETKEIANETIIKMFLAQEGVEEAVDKEAVKKIEDENAKLKKEIEALKAQETKEAKPGKKSKKQKEEVK